MAGIGLSLMVINCQPTTDELNPTIIIEKTPNEPTETLPPVASIATTSATTSPSEQSPTPMSALSPTNAPTNAPTLLPTSTPLPTETLSPTPWPTLPSDEAINQVMSLLVDNQNPDCLLPCWWDATPGQTNWQNIKPFLDSIATKVRTTSWGASVTLPLPESIAVTGFDYNVVYVWNSFGIINEIDIDLINIPGYDAKTMVGLYGIPDEVWLATIAEPREGVLPFQLIIVYQQQGISFRYYVDATKHNEIITACFEPGIEMERPDLFPAGPKIYVWEPGQHKSIEEISLIPGETYYPLADKTDLTPETLHKKFTNPNEHPCIDTLADLWRDY